jgi:hypothetical protein
MDAAHEMLKSEVGIYKTADGREDPRSFRESPQSRMV